MLAEVEGERGALPLLAFAAARLWEMRDRETGLLTRQAYQDIGGVGGALARHAEATIDRIGSERIAIVRELFRNLVTAEGTRAVREWDELLSVFERAIVARRGFDRRPYEAGGCKLDRGAVSSPRRRSLPRRSRELIDARLLTSYEVREDEHEPTRRVEIIHESLLANWPRLVRWQTQDADGAQLRDQLRQAARTWEEHGARDDLLWTGTAYREYPAVAGTLPRRAHRHRGGVRHRHDLARQRRRRRRRRIAVAAAFAVLLAVLGVVGGFWQRWSPRPAAPRPPTCSPWPSSSSRSTRPTPRLRHRQPRAGRQPRGAAAGAGGPVEGPDRASSPTRQPLLARLQPRRPLAGDGRPRRRRQALAIGRRCPDPPRGERAPWRSGSAPRGDLVAANMEQERQQDRALVVSGRPLPALVRHSATRVPRISSSSPATASA